RLVDKLVPLAGPLRVLRRCIAAGLPRWSPVDTRRAKRRRDLLREGNGPGDLARWRGFVGESRVGMVPECGPLPSRGRPIWREVRHLASGIFALEIDFREACAAVQRFADGDTA